MTTRVWLGANVAAGVLLMTCAACRAPRALPPEPPPPAHALAAENLPAGTRVELEIGSLSELPSDDKVEVLVSGAIVNRGTRPTTSVIIHVSSLDAAGRVVRTVEVTPSSQRIPANGGAVTFSAVLPNDAAVVDYHVEA